MPSTLEVAIAVGPGVTDSGLAVALDVLRAANAVCRHGGRRAPFAITVCGPRGMRAASGLRLGGLAADAAADRADALFVPGTWLTSEREVSAWLAGRQARRLTGLAGRAAGRGAMVLGSCSGTLALAQAGILDGLEATTVWWLAGLFGRLYPRVRLDPTRALVDCGRIVTAGAVLAQMDLALHLVRRTAGPEVATQVTRTLLLVEHPAQAPYMAIAQLTSDDGLLRSAERWVRRHLGEPLALPDIARGIGTSPRTLARRARAALATSPGRWIRRMRAEEAVRLLETTSLPVERVAEAVGFGAASTLRREVLRHTGIPPRAVRARGQ